MKLSPSVWIALAALVALPVSAYPQVAVEYGLGAGRAATTAAPARSLGQGIGGVFNSLSKTLEAAPSGAGSQRTAAAANKSAPSAPAKKADGALPAALPVTTEDPAGIQAGMDYGEVIRRFGQPGMEVTGDQAGKTLWYTGKSGTVQVGIEKGKVASIENGKPPESASITLP